MSSCCFQNCFQNEPVKEKTTLSTHETNNICQGYETLSQIYFLSSPRDGALQIGEVEIRCKELEKVEN